METMVRKTIRFSYLDLGDGSPIVLQGPASSH